MNKLEEAFNKLAVKATSVVQPGSANVDKTLISEGYRKTDYKEWKAKDEELMNQNIKKINNRVNVAKGMMGTAGGVTGGILGSSAGHFLSKGKGKWRAAGAIAGGLLGAVVGTKTVSRNRADNMLHKYKMSRAAVQDAAAKKKFNFYVKD